MFNKYKERDALETVRIIQDFFKSLNGFVIEERQENNDSGFWWHELMLKYNDTEVVMSYGKGETREYSLASAYAELYERFAWYYNNMNEDDSCVFAYETPIDAKTLVKPFPQVDDKDEGKAWYNALLNRFGKVAAVPFKNVWGEDTLLIDMNAKAEADGSNGIAAGNTLLEALNQGLSELIERYVQNLCYMGIVDLNEIPTDIIASVAPSIYQKIQRLNKLGVDVKIYDTSQTTGLPVVCSIIIDKNTMMHRFCFGAFPVFSIALERTLTEVFQGQLKTRHDFSPCEPYQKNDVSIDAVRNNRTGFPRKPFVKATVTSKINTNVYLPEDVSNTEINTHFKNMLTAKGITAYYYDMSLMDEVKAVYIHSPELESHIEFGTFCGDICGNRVLGVLEALSGEFTEQDAVSLMNIIEHPYMEETRTLHYLFFKTEIRESYMDYLYGICNLLVKRYNDAYKYLSDVSYNDFPELTYLKLFLKYKTSPSRDILSELVYWGVPKDLATALVNIDREKILEVYIKNLLFGEKAQKTKADFKKVRGVIVKKRLAITNVE